MFTALLVLALIALVCVALVRVGDAGRQIVELRRRNGYLESKVDYLAALVTSQDRPPAAPSDPGAAPAPAGGAPTPTPSPGAAPPHPRPPAAAPQAPGAPRKAARAPGRTSREWEALIGEKLLNRVGALTLILAAGFFLKYAFAHNWIPPVVRILMGVAAGGGLVAVATRVRGKLPVFAQGILGAGLGILYLSAYASFGFYHLVPIGIAFAAMAVVTGVVLERALSFDSRAVALLGWTGGFLTPLLLRSGGDAAGSGPGLFLYLFLLTATLVAMVWRRPAWAVLEPLTLLGTYGNYLGWRALSAPAPLEGGDIALPLVFLTGIWAAFFALDVLRAANGRTATTEDHLWSSANGVLYFVAALELLTPGLSAWRPLLTVLLALAYIAPVAVLKRQMPAFTLKAISLLAVATALQLDGYPRAVAWSLEAAALVAVGVSSRAAHVRYGGLALMGIGLGATVLMPSTFAQALSSYEPAASGRSLALALQAAALAAAAWSYRRTLAGRPGDGDAGSRPAEQALHFGWTAVLLLLVSVEVTDYLRLLHSRGDFGTASQVGYTATMVLVPVWALFGVATGWVGRRLRLDGVAGGSLVAMGLAAVAATAGGFRFVPVAEFQPVVNLRLLAVASAAGGCIVHRHLLGGSTKLRVAARRALGVAAGILVFVGLTGEISDFYGRRLLDAGEAAAAGIRNQRQLALSIGWLVYAAVALGVGFWKRTRSLRLAAIAMLGISVLKVFLVDLSFLEQGYRILSFLGLGVLLLAASFLYTKHRDVILGTDGRGPPPGGPPDREAAPVH